MATKTPSIAAATKKSIKLEISGLNLQRRKLVRQLQRDVQIRDKQARKFAREIEALKKSFDRDTAIIDRRLGILTGRL